MQSRNRSLKTWELTILGCGTSTGVPLLFCDCKTCGSTNPKNFRLRASAWLQISGKNLLIDTSVDLRQQALAQKIPRVDAILFTHPHADHVSGIDEIRSNNFKQKERIPAYGNAWTCRDLRERFGYIFSPAEKMEGGGIALIDLTEFSTSVESLDVVGIPVIPIALSHGTQECVGYRVGPLAYLTDCSSISEDSLNRLQGLDTLILDCLRISPHPTHLNLTQALAMVDRLKPGRTILTHLGHDFEYSEWSEKLPPGIELAYDGLRVSGSH